MQEENHFEPSINRILIILFHKDFNDNLLGTDDMTSPKIKIIFIFLTSHITIPIKRRELK
jgi:hypothetical protein